MAANVSLLTDITLFGGDDGYDVHLLPGTKSRRFKDNLWLNWNNQWVTASTAINGVTVSFKALLLGSLADYGLQVSSTTGEVSVSQSAPRIAVNNFLVEVTVKDNNVNPAEQLKTVIRIQRHNTVRGVWLTPSPLTIKLGSTGSRLTLLAEFDDGVVGDITRCPGLTWSSSNPAVISFDSASQKGTAPYNDAQGASTNPGGLLYALQTSGEANVTARLPASFGGLTSGPATVKARGSWTDPYTVEYVGGAGEHRMEEVPNLLFLCEGFKETDAERRSFRNLTQKIVLALNLEKITQPFNLLRSSMNFWRAFVPSPEGGASILYPLVQEVRQGRTFANPVPQPKSLPTDATPWEIEHLIYVVGLPVSSDSQANVTFDSKKSYWKARYPNFKEGDVTQELFDQWKSYADYRLAFETNSFFGVRLGDRPRAEDAAHDRTMLLNDRRTSSSDVDSLLIRLKNLNGGALIGERWCTGKKDSGYVYLLCGGTRYGGTKSSLVISSVTEKVEVGVQPHPGSRALKVVPSDLPLYSELSAHTIAVVAHETAHAFGLGDEYAYGREQEFPQSQSASLKGTANLQCRQEVVVQVTNAQEKIDPGKLKWLWPRIQKAGVLREYPFGMGDTVQLHLKREHGAAFRPKDMVRLRRRPLLEHPQPSAWFKVVAVVGDNLQIEIPPDTTFRNEDYPAGSVVFTSVTEPPVAPAELSTADRKLIAKSVYDHIQTHGGPLNAPANDPLRACVVDIADEQKLDNYPANWNPRFSRYVVGAFDGGSEYGCGIYHPTAACIMRSITGPNRKVVEFCHVCRYFLVDLIDPSKHGKIDEDFGRNYPNP